MTGRAADFVPDAVDHRLAKIGLECAFVLGFECVETPQRLEHRVLDEVVGVQHVARKARQAPTRPPPERRQIAREEYIDRGTATGLRQFEQFEG